MEVRFRSRQLERAFTLSGIAMRVWGQRVGLRYVHRIALILDVEEFSHLFAFASLRLHPLTGERQGQYAMTLAGRWRLILSLEGSVVVIEEVSNHYD